MRHYIKDSTGLEISPDDDSREQEGRAEAERELYSDIEICAECESPFKCKRLGYCEREGEE